MKKTLFELTIEEFTSVLLDYEPILTLSISAYDEKGNFINKQLTDGADEDINVRGRYSDFQNALRKSNSNNGVEKATRDFLYSQFDYDIQINKLDIYNYLEHITCNFETEKVKIVLNEMECFYQMTYLEDMDEEVKDKYIENEWEFPTKDLSIPDSPKNGENKTHKVADLNKMRERLYPFRDFTYLSAVSLLKRKMPSQHTKENSQFKSDICLSKKKGTKVNFIRVINCLYEMGFFKDKDDNKIDKQKVMETFGTLLNQDLSNYCKDLTATRSSSNSDGNSLTKIFHEMLDKQKEINNMN